MTSHNSAVSSNITGTSQAAPAAGKHKHGRTSKVEVAAREGVTQHIMCGRLHILHMCKLRPLLNEGQ
jgi:hypothetical protein